MGTTRIWGFALLIMSALFVIPGSWAQNYPTKPIRLVVPSAPGGSADFLGRTIARKLTDVWGQPVVVTNHPGGTGAVVAEITAKASADGYTLLLASASLLVISPSLQSDLPYDTVKDLAPIASIANAPLVLVANLSVPANSVKELVALAKARPNSLNYGTSGVGSLGNMTMELFKTVTGTNIVHIPYKGVSIAVTDLLGDHVQLMISAPGVVIPQVRAGKLKGFAVTGLARAAELKDVPTFNEAGYPEVKASSWYGMLTTAGTSKSLVHKLNQEIVRIVQSPDVKERFLANGYNVETRTPEEFEKLIKDELAMWRNLAKASGAPR